MWRPRSAATNRNDAYAASVVASGGSRGQGSTSHPPGLHLFQKISSITASNLPLHLKLPPGHLPQQKYYCKTSQLRKSFVSVSPILYRNDLSYLPKCCIVVYWDHNGMRIMSLKKIYARLFRRKPEPVINNDVATD